MNDLILARRVVRLIEDTKIGVTTEAQAHAAIAALLTENDIAHEQEFSLSKRDRIDLLVNGSIGIEVKVGHQKRAIAAQLQRYSEHDQISCLILATGRSWPRNFILKNGTPLFTASLNRGWL